MKSSVEIQLLTHGKNNLIALLKSFTKPEMKEFVKFSRSLFFNKRIDVTNYISAIAKYHPDFECEELTKQKLHSLVYPGKKFSDINIRRLNSHSLKLGEDYLYFIHGKNDSFEKDNYIILEYMKRDSIGQAAQKVERCLKELRMDSLFLRDYYERRSKLNYYKSLLERYKKKDSRYGQYLIRACSDNLTSSFAELATNFSTLCMEKSLFKIDLSNSVVYSFFNDLEIQKMLIQAKESGDENYPFLRLHYLMATCIQNTLNDESYKEFNELLAENESKMSHDTLVQFGMFRYNYIFQKLKDITPRVVHLGIYELTKELCLKNLLRFSYEPYIVRGHGIILGAGDLAGSKGDIDFLVYLQEHLVKQLHPEFRYLTGQFLKLHENYLRKNYNECIKILNSTQVDHYLFFQRFKILEVQIFFDMGEYELVLNLVDSFKHFYKKKHVTAQIFQVIMKFLNVVAKLSKLSISFSKEEAMMIEKAINEIDANTLRNWLVPRLQLISGRFNRVS